MIRLDIDFEGLKKVLGTAAKQVPYAAAIALNRTALDIQKEQRKKVRKDFTLRRAKFILNTIKIEKGGKARKDNLRVLIGIDPRRNLLAKFEDGGVKVADRDRPEIVPTKHLRRRKRDLPPTWSYPKNLRLQERRTASGFLAAQKRVSRRGVTIWQGKQRTFVLDPAEHFGVKVRGVYQRTGPKRDDVRLLWVYKDKIHIPRRLGFLSTMRRVSRERLHINFVAAYKHALRTAKVR